MCWAKRQLTGKRSDVLHTCALLCVQCQKQDMRGHGMQLRHARLPTEVHEEDVTHLLCLGVCVCVNK